MYGRGEYRPRRMPPHGVRETRAACVYMCVYAIDRVYATLINPAIASQLGWSELPKFVRHAGFRWIEMRGNVANDARVCMRVYS